MTNHMPSPFEELLLLIDRLAIPLGERTLARSRAHEIYKGFGFRTERYHWAERNAGILRRFHAKDPHRPDPSDACNDDDLIYGP